MVIDVVWNTADSSHEDDFLGYLYLALFARPGKYARAYQTTMSLGFIDATGTRHCPPSALVCSFTCSTDESGHSRLTLLQHTEVVTTFHELGHSISYLFSRAKSYALPFPKDFVEIPCLFLEHLI